MVAGFQLAGFRDFGLGLESWVSGRAELPLGGRHIIINEAERIPAGDSHVHSGAAISILSLIVAHSMTVSTTRKSLFNSTLCNLFYFLRAVHISTPETNFQLFA